MHHLPENGEALIEKAEKEESGLMSGQAPTKTRKQPHAKNG